MQLEVIPDGVPLYEAFRHSFGDVYGKSLYKKIVDRIGEEPESELGHGMAGVAYLLPSGKCLKVTSSVGELQAMQILKGVRHPNLVHVYDVFAVKDGGRGVGIVLRDTVDEIIYEILDEGQKRLLNIAKTNAGMKYGDLIHDGADEEEALEAGMKAYLSYLRKWRRERLFSGIISGVEKLRKLGILGIDFHEFNIGVDGEHTSDERAVIFDMGAQENDIEVAVIENPPIETS